MTGTLRPNLPKSRGRQMLARPKVNIKALRLVAEAPEEALRLVGEANHRHELYRRDLTRVKVLVLLVAGPKPSKEAVQPPPAPLGEVGQPTPVQVMVHPLLLYLSNLRATLRRLVSKRQPVSKRQLVRKHQLVSEVA